MKVWLIRNWRGEHSIVAQDALQFWIDHETEHGYKTLYMSSHNDYFDLDDEDYIEGYDSAYHGQLVEIYE